MNSAPTGTVTFLFTDIEGSTKRWEQYPQQMRAALARHDALLRSAVEGRGGYVFKTVGDAFCAAFATPHDALSAALDAQHAVHNEQWPSEIGLLRVRMALHTGAAEERDGDYFGQPLNRVARLLSAGHGGQTLLSEVTYGLVRDHLPPSITLLDLGEHRLKDLFRPERIYQLLAPNLPSEFPPLNTLDNRPNNLPAQTTPLVGRETEVAAVVEHLRNPQVRLLTLTGTGGTGKTRLGLQVAAEVLDDYPQGVFWVSLAPILDPHLMASTIAQVLGVQEGAGKPLTDSLKEYLRDKELLLLLDNYEQVASSAPLVSELLASAPKLKVLVTSREALHLRGEHEYPVPPLALPDHKQLPPLERLTQYEAVRLFIDRAQAAKPDFAVSNDNAPSVAEICVKLDGLPLAIELAAARIKLLPPQAMLTRLQSRLTFLTGGARDLPARQQTLRNTIEWSHDLLSEGEKQLFRRMAVFMGGRTLEGLEAVCNSEALQVEGQRQRQVDVLEGVELLINKSLLQQREGRGGEPRFWMLETIHEYAREKLEESGEEEALRREHALYYLRLVEEAEPQLTGAKQQEWLDRLEDEHDNIRAAMGWAREKGEGEAEVGLRLAGAMWRFWYVRGYFSEGREYLEGATSNRGASGAHGAVSQVGEGDQVGEGAGGTVGGTARAKALNGAGALARLQGDYTAARSLLGESLAIRRELGDKKGIAISLNGLGNVALEQGDYTAARSLLEESLTLRRELGDKWGIAASLNGLGNVALEQGDYTAARSLLEESLAIRRELGDKWGIAASLNNLGVVAQQQGDFAAARSLYEEYLSISRELGDKWGIPYSLNGLGNVALEQGDYTAARSHFEECLTIRRELGDKRGIAASLAGLGGVAAGAKGATGTAGTVAIGQPYLPQIERAGWERAARLLGAVERILEATGAVLYADERRPYERNVALVRSALGDEAFERAWAEGRAMSMEAATEYALHWTEVLATNQPALD